MLMGQDMGRGIIAPRNNTNIGTGASEMRTLGATTAAAINDLDTETAKVYLPKQDAYQYGIEGKPGPVGPPSEVPGPPGPGGSIALEETDPGCFVDSPITWVEWDAAGAQASVWNPVHDRYDPLLPAPRLISTGIYEIGT